MKKFLLLILFCTGCETIVEIDIPKDEPRLVLNGFFNPDSTFSISLFQSQHILEVGEYRAIEDAAVSIFNADGGKVTELIDAGSGKYISIFKPEVGKEYRIEASKDGFETIESSDMIPFDSARVISIELNLTEPGFEGEASGVYDIDFMLKDFTGTDFYEVQILARSVYEIDGERVDYRNYQYLESEDAVFDDFASSGIGLLFNDVLFDEKESTITVTTFLNLDHNCDLVPECISEEYFLLVKKVSESYFDYNRTLALQRELEGDPFAEPVSVFNNITNGFGIFSGYRDSIYELDAPEN